jgi:predicted RNA-binding Zn-ribbon protein involved in translation (DUF1610 family)
MNAIPFYANEFVKELMKQGHVSREFRDAVEESCPKCGEPMRLVSARRSAYWRSKMVEKYECEGCGFLDVREIYI